MMATLADGRRFSVLIVSRAEVASAARCPRPAMAIKQLAQAGVEIFEYVHGQSLTPKNAIDEAAVRPCRASPTRTTATDERARARGAHALGEGGSRRRRARLRLPQPRRLQRRRRCTADRCAVAHRARHQPGRGRRRAAHLRALRRGRGAEADRHAAERRGRGGPEAVRAEGPDEGAARGRLVAVDRADHPHARALSRRRSSGTSRASATTSGR